MRGSSLGSMERSWWCLTDGAVVAVEDEEELRVDDDVDVDEKAEAELEDT